MVVPRAFAGALARGCAVEMMYNVAGPRRDCGPTAVWHDARKQRLVGFLGAEL